MHGCSFIELNLLSAVDNPSINTGLKWYQKFQRISKDVRVRDVETLGLQAAKHYLIIKITLLSLLCPPKPKLSVSWIRSSKEQAGDHLSLLPEKAVDTHYTYWPGNEYDLDEITDWSKLYWVGS